MVSACKGLDFKLLLNTEANLALIQWHKVASPSEELYHRSLTVLLAERLYGYSARLI